MLFLRYSASLRLLTAVLLTLLLPLAARAQTAYKLASGTYSEDYSQISNWGNNFASGTGAAPYSAAPANVNATTAGATTVFSTGTSAGAQRGTQALVLLATGSSDNFYVGVDLNLDFTNTTAGTISLDWASITNSTGNRSSTFKLQTNTGASGAFVDLPGSSVVITNGTLTSGQFRGLSLPAALSGSASAKIRFLLTTSSAPTTATISGSRPKISLDNVQVTATAASTPPPTAAATITTTASTYNSPWCITSSAGSPAFNVAFTSTGSFTGAFQAQLSDATGAFADAISNLIGSATTSPISATIPAGTPSGSAYRIRVLNGTTLGTDNGSSLTINLAPATNPVTLTPADDQSFAINATGTLLTAKPAVASTLAWFYGTAATGPFPTSLPSTTTTYQPKGADFAAVGTYYVVAQATSTCGSVVGVSAPVKVVITENPAAFTVSATSLPDFGTVRVGSTAPAKSFAVAGTGLTDALTITPAPGFEIRTGQTPFACCAIVLTPSGGSVASTQIDVRFAPQLAQAYADKIAVTSPGFPEQDVAVTGTAIVPTYPATVSTTAATNITTTTATAGGSVVDDGGSPVTAYGVAYGIDAEPTVASTHTTDGSGLATFSSSLTNLRPGVLYYVRAYATNAQGTTYGEQFSFTTVAVPLADEPTASSSLTASNVRSARVLLTFTGGTGAKHLVLAHLNGTVSQDPTDATTYTASSTFGKGSVLGSDADNYVVFAAVGDTVTVFGLRPNTPYSFAVYDYNDNNTPYAENYRTSDPSTLSLTTPALPPTLLLKDNFVYTASTLLTANGWAAHSGAGTKSFTVTNGSLTYLGYSTGYGNSTAFTGSGEDVNRPFPTVYARTAVYVSCLVNVTNATTTGDYFLHLGPTVLSTNFRGRLFAKKSATGTLQFGVAGSGTPVYSPSDYAFNTTYLLLLKYSFDETGNETDLFVNPATSGTTYRLTATPDASAPETVSSTPTDIGTIALRQGTNSPTLTIDALAIATAFPLADGGPLPVTLTHFTAQASGHAVQLAWQTASEVNSSYFVVERSVDGHTFTALQTVTAAGTSTTPRAYTALDAQTGALGVTQLYYRLHSVDLDGTSAYSPVQAVTLTPAAAGLAIFPNPASRATTLTGAVAGARIQVLDALGRTVTTSTADATGAAELTLPAGLASGVYIVRTGSQALRLLVQ